MRLPMMFAVLLFLSSGCSREEGLEKKPAVSDSSAARKAAEAGEEILSVYLSPRGDDRNDGTRKRPILSLARAHEILAQRKPHGDVVIKVKSDAGDYVDQNVLWTYYRPDHTITIESDPPDVNASFVADDTPPTRPFFTLIAMRGEATNIILRHLTVRDYVARAVLFLGEGQVREYWNGFNAIEGCVFHGIGNARMPARPIAYSAIALVNSRNNRIVGCTFINIMNHTLANFPQKGRGVDNPAKGIGDDYRKLQAHGAGSNPNIPIIAVYLAHCSGSNLVSGCTFRRVKGDAIRIRDDSNGNTFEKNSFELTGWNAIVSLWYCDPSKQGCFKELEQERASSGNVFRGNTVNGNWKGGMPQLFRDLLSKDGTGAHIDPKILLGENNTCTAYH